MASDATAGVKQRGAFPHTWVVYSSLVGLLALELGLSFALYKHVERRCEAPSIAYHSSSTRSKRSLSNDNTVYGETNVEFVNPEARKELEEKDAARRAAAAAAGIKNHEDNNPWVWLTSYSRIPLVAIQGFCSATRDYCPPGPQGPPGLPGVSGEPGEKGERGDRGFPGEGGLRGPQGTPGENGPRGPKGDTGAPGLDGRDGVPGEPGLDGIPGRNGLDGIPGVNGIPGFNGEPGLPGVNGTDGRPGSVGPVGPPGVAGPRGLPGPRGRPGKPGHHGTPGIPGISAWVVNGTQGRELLIPPSIAGATSVLESKAIVVQEGDNVRLRCAASGQPRPDVEWRFLDGSTIPLGSWRAVSVTGHTLNITLINRMHMGRYQCIANNGVPPEANQTFTVEVHFQPLIRIVRQIISVSEGYTAKLECYVEAFPDAVRYWERSDGSLIEPGDKYRMSVTEFGRYKALMQLNITRVGPKDYGKYSCISKNEIGLTRALINVESVDPNRAKPPSIIDQSEVVYGQLPPKLTDLDDLCPAPPACPDCPTIPTDSKKTKCHDGGLSLFDLLGRMEIRPFGNETYPGLPNRTLDCELTAVGKPVYHRYTDANYGGWMRDPMPRNTVSADKYYVTKDKDPYTLYEYANKTVFRKEIATRNYSLTPGFRGNSHVVYNGSFYYNQLDDNRIIRYDLLTYDKVYATLPMAPHDGDNFLYTTEYNYVDFAVDENGLWVVYGLPENNNTIVIKMDAYTLKFEYAWNISVDHHKVGETFIVCGVLYAVDSVTDRDSKIRFALDLYRNKLLDLILPFTNPFRRTTMISYNARNKELYTWDKGNQLTYPVRYNDIGLNISKEDHGSEPGEAVAQVQTGYEIYN